MPKKMQTGDGWGHGISRGIEEIGISRGVQEKVMCNFYGVLLFDLGISKGCHTSLLNFWEKKACFIRNF